MKYFKISASLNQGISELFENITRDIIYKMNDEDLINRSRSIKLGYNNISMFKNEDNFDLNYYNNENKSLLTNRNNKFVDKIDRNERGSNNDIQENYKYSNKDSYNNSNFTGCCKII